MISRISLAALLFTALTATAQTPDPGFLQLKYVTVVVRDYDEALKWYTDVLGWRKVEDRAFGPQQRWIVVAPQSQNNIGIVLDRPSARSKRGVKFIAPPKTQPWGTSQAIFEDLYGNVFVVESSAAPSK